MNSMRGVLSMKIPTSQGDIAQFLVTEAKNQKLAKQGQKIAIVVSTNEDQVEEKNVLEILSVE